MLALGVGQRVEAEQARHGVTVRGQLAVARRRAARAERDPVPRPERMVAPGAPGARTVLPVQQPMSRLQALHYQPGEARVGQPKLLGEGRRRSRRRRRRRRRFPGVTTGMAGQLGAVVDRRDPAVAIIQPDPVALPERMAADRAGIGDPPGLFGGHGRAGGGRVGRIEAAADELRELVTRRGFGGRRGFLGRLGSSLSVGRGLGVERLLQGPRELVGDRRRRSQPGSLVGVGLGLGLGLGVVRLVQGPRELAGGRRGRDGRGHVDLVPVAPMASGAADLEVPDLKGLEEVPARVGLVHSLPSGTCSNRMSAVSWPWICICARPASYALATLVPPTASPV